MNICSRCGERLHAGSKFCQNCSTKAVCDEKSNNITNNFSKHHRIFEHLARLLFRIFAICVTIWWILNSLYMMFSGSYRNFDPFLTILSFVVPLLLLTVAFTDDLPWKNEVVKRLFLFIFLAVLIFAYYLGLWLFIQKYIEPQIGATLSGILFFVLFLLPILLLDHIPDSFKNHFKKNSKNNSN